MASVAKNILHVDDDPQITRIVAKKLEHFGFTVKSVNDPLAAMPCITQENFRVVLLDIEMPGKDGMQLLEEIKHHDGGVQVVLLTGIVTLQTALMSLRRGAEACFFKPLNDFEPLAEAIDACFTKINRWWATMDELSRRRTGKFPAASEQSTQSDASAVHG